MRAKLNWGSPLPAACTLTNDHPSPVRTPSFRGYYAGNCRVPAEVIKRFPHLTTVKAAAAADAERAQQRVASSARPVRRALDTELKMSAPPSAPPSPPSSP
mmetsp:Transcript_22364/g.43470  ORF Transcript_22364/g.43470 Transcript_22364/m.43470 type:complete len:101 (+) Transcript_22364:30-332(+)